MYIWHVCQIFYGFFVTAFQELKEEFTRILTANNPHAPQNIVRYSFKVCIFFITVVVSLLSCIFFCIKEKQNSDVNQYVYIYILKRIRYAA